MDNNTLFFETVKRGLWIAAPQGQRVKYVIADINGTPVASSKSLPVALTVALGKVQKEISNGATVSTGNHA